MKQLVTGVAGFVGSALAATLVERADPGDEVVGMDVVTDYYDVAQKRANLARLVDPSFTFLQDDLLTTDLDALLDGVDVVYHQAGQPGVRPSWGASFGPYVRQNVEVTQRLLEAVRRADHHVRVVYASSSSVYGDAERYPVLESDSPAPMSPYGVTKLAAEHLCGLYARNFGVDAVSLRYFTVYGPGQRPDMAFHRFCAALRDGRAIELYGDGTQVRDFTYIDDVVAANLAAGRARGPVAGSVFNVCGGSAVTVNDVFDVLTEIVGHPLRVERVGRAPGDVFRTGGSHEAARTQLGWEPLVGIREGLKAEYDWVVSPR